MKDYMRGATENKFDTVTTLTAFDSNGKLLSTRKAKDRLEYVKGRFKGAGLDESKEGDWASTIRISNSKRRIVGAELVNAVELLMAPAFIFGPDAKSKWSFDISDSSGSLPMIITYRSIEQCSSFEASGDGFQPKKGFCGSGKIQIQEGGQIPLRVEMEALGLPLTTQTGVLNSYRGESEFQYVSVLGSKQRLVFPRITTGTFVFQDRKTVIQTTYAFHPGK